MSFTPENIAELDLLLLYDLSTSRAGIKIHGDAKDSVKEAARRLFEKGFISQEDGGYLTTFGITTAEHAQALMMSLNSEKAR